MALTWSGGKLDTVDIVIGYSESIILSGLAGKFKLPKHAVEKGEDIVVMGSKDTQVSLCIKKC